MLAACRCERRVLRADRGGDLGDPLAGAGRSPGVRRHGRAASTNSGVKAVPAVTAVSPTIMKYRKVHAWKGCRRHAGAGARPARSVASRSLGAAGRDRRGGRRAFPLLRAAIRDIRRVNADGSSNSLEACGTCCTATGCCTAGCSPSVVLTTKLPDTPSWHWRTASTPATCTLASAITYTLLVILAGLSPREGQALGRLDPGADRRRDHAGAAARQRHPAASLAAGPHRHPGSAADRVPRAGPGARRWLPARSRSACCSPG